MHKCPFCEKEYKLPQHMVQHLQKAHGYTNEQLQDLYDKMYLNGVRPKCKFYNCDKAPTFISFVKGYRDCCGQGHATAYKTFLKHGTWSTLHTPEVEEKVKKIFEEKFEGGHPGKDPKVHEKGKATLLKEHGVDHPMKIDSVKEKFFNTVESKYGGRSSMCSEEVREKSKETCIKKYGVQYPAQAEITKQHIKETLETRYGPGIVASSQVPEVREKILKTFQERYGGNSPMCSREVISKREETLMTMTGGKKSNQALPEVSRKSQMRKRATIGEIGYVNSLRHTYFCCCEPLFTREDYFKCNPLRYKCKKCGKEHTVNSWSYIRTCCGNTSNIEVVVIEMLNTMNVKYVTKDRQILLGKELDFYIPDQHLAIECNGMWWHSENHGTDKNYHLWKTDTCLNNGVTLLHFWESELLDKSDICYSMISSRLGIVKHKYRASDLRFTQVDISVSNKFMEDNHIQGKIRGVRYAFALVDKLDNIISCIQFTNRRAIFGYSETDDNVIELARYSSVLNSKVYGGFTKLIQNSIPILKENGKTVIETYCDRRFSPDASKTVYARYGFILLEQTKPSYWYCDNEGMKHRFTYTKKALVELFHDQIEDIENKSEDTIAKEAGIFKLWDCGQFKFKLEI